jgi:hypothetical protein
MIISTLRLACQIEAEREAARPNRNCIIRRKSRRAMLSGRYGPSHASSQRRARSGAIVRLTAVTPE